MVSKQLARGAAKSHISKRCITGQMAFKIPKEACFYGVNGLKASVLQELNIAREVPRKIHDPSKGQAIASAKRPFFQPVCRTQVVADKLNDLKLWKEHFGTKPIFISLP